MQQNYLLFAFYLPKLFIPLFIQLYSPTFMTQYWFPQRPLL